MAVCSCGCGNTCTNKFVHGHHRRGVKASQETIDKRRATLLDPEFNKKWREKMSAGWTEESKEALRRFNLGKKLSDDHKKKIGIGNSGKIRSEGFKEKLSKINKGKISGDNNPMRKPEVSSGFKGDKNPNWKGGRSKGYKTGYNSAEYKNWRKEVFKRDGYSCQKCGIMNVYITAHHIKSFAYFPELRFEVSNGLTLCEKCHSMTDNYKGRAKTVQKNLLLNNTI